MMLKDRFMMLKDRFGANQADILKILNDNGIEITLSAIKSIWQGRTKKLKPEYAIILAKHFNISRDWIQYGTGYMNDKNDDDIVTLQDLALIANSLDKNTITIPFYENINASAGYGCANEEDTPNYIKLVNGLIPSKSKKIEAIKVYGDSMIPTVFDGDIIFIDTNSKYFENGKIFVVYLAGEVFIKRLFKNPNSDKLILKSDNPLFPQFEAIADDFMIIGKVIANMNIKEL